MIDLLFLVGIVVILTAIVYVLVILSTKEKSFEEAVKEQKQKIEQEQAQQKADKVHKKNKLKKSSKNKKDESDTGQSGMYSKVDMVDISKPQSQVLNNIHESVPSSQVIQQDSIENNSVNQVKKRGKKAKIEKVDEAEPKKIHVEEVCSAKDVVETKPSSLPAPTPPVSLPAREKNEKLEKKEHKKEKKVVEPVIEEPVTEVIKEQVQTAVAPPEKSAPILEKKIKKEKIKPIVTEVTSQKLIQLVEKAHLTGTEIQGLIDSLLQLGGSKGGEWQEKGRIDPAALLRRQLEEVEHRLKAEQDAKTALSTKITDLRGELNSEKSRSAQSKRQLETVTANHQKALENAQIRGRESQSTAMNELKASLEKDFQLKMQQQKQVVSNEEQLQVQIQQLKCSLSDAELRATAAQQEHEELNQRCQKYEQHITSLEEKYMAENSTNISQINDLKKQLSATDMTLAKVTSERDQLSIQVNNINQDIAREQITASTAQLTLQESIRDKAELESRLVQLDTDLKATAQIVQNQNAQIECLKEEKESLASQSVRPDAEGQENGDVHSENQLNSSIPHNNHLEILVKEKEMFIEQQSSEVSKLKLEVNRLNEELSTQKHKNDDKLSVVEEEHRRTRECLGRLYPHITIDNKLDQVAFLKQFEAQAAQVKPKEIIVEKVIEKIVEDEGLKKLVSQLKSENATLKQRLEKATEESTASTQVDTSNTEEVSKLQKENKSLEEKVSHYQTVLADTEALLKSLEASVEGEESAWKKKLVENEALLTQLTADKLNLQTKVEQLENTIEKVKQAEEAGDEQSLPKLQEENVKLRALLNMGQDSSRQQEQLISQLQQELSAAKNGTNGPNCEEQCADGGAGH